MTCRRLLLSALLLLPALLAPPALAKLDGAAWRDVQERAGKLFPEPGNRDEKLEILARLVEDGEPRAWKLIVEGLVAEAEHWTDAQKAVRDKEDQIQEVQSKPMAKRYPQEQRELDGWKKELVDLEGAARAERELLDAFTHSVAEGPEALRKNLFNRAKGPVSWSVRAAAARVAAVHPEENLSFEHLSRALEGDKDPRVRMAGLEALRELATGADEENGNGNGKPVVSPDVVDTAEGLIIGRLADEDWGVQLLAVRIAAARKMTNAIPHLINALAFASPRVVESIGELLRELTGENFDPYADVWAKWWEDNKERFKSEERAKGGKNKRPPSDAHFYGLPVKSDRVLFIIDTSDSMKHPTQNKNPAEKWQPPKGPTTPGEEEEPPPPPPPEEILSGPKIEVAKHELKKALEKLPASCKFNIIAFDTSVRPWKDGMVDASEKNKKDALTWVRAMQPKGITFIDGALRAAFRLAGLGAVDTKYQDINVDTMILLSDGAPTDDDIAKVNLMDPEIILQHVREWNRHKRIVINCIGIDMVAGIEFLQKLAEENGGVYVDR